MGIQMVVASITAGVLLLIVLLRWFWGTRVGRKISLAWGDAYDYANTISDLSSNMKDWSKRQEKSASVVVPDVWGKSAYRRMKLDLGIIACMNDRLSPGLMGFQLLQAKRKLTEKSKPAKDYPTFPCLYCNRLWDPSKYESCPSCGAPPEKEKRKRVRIPQIPTRITQQIIAGEIVETRTFPDGSSVFTRGLASFSTIPLDTVIVDRTETLRSWLPGGE